MTRLLLILSLRALAFTECAPPLLRETLRWEVKHIAKARRHASHSWERARHRLAHDLLQEIHRAGHLEVAGQPR